MKFLNDLDSESDFDKHFATKKLVKQNHSYLKHALTLNMNNKNITIRIHFTESAKCSKMMWEIIMEIIWDANKNFANINLKIFKLLFEYKIT